MEQNKVKKVAIIGAGAAGLPSIRHAVLYGFDVVCYEAQDDIGGLWRYKPEETAESSVMKTTVINSSKELTAYSDFPPKAEAANYMHHTCMYEYLRDYAEHYNLFQNIRLNTRVLNMERTSNYMETGQWNVTSRDLKSDQVSTEVFDGVLVCTGHHTLPHFPKPWLSQDGYKGRILHAHSYKDSRGYEDKTVVVVGVGNSGGDIAVELSRIAKQVYVVTRRGTWVFHRIFEYGRPIDCQLNTRFFDSLIRLMPSSLVDKLAQHLLNKQFDHETYGLKPPHPVFSAHPTVNDELPNRIGCGTIRVKPSITEFVGDHSIRFQDGSVVDDVDVVIVCTGYSFEFPILENGNLIKVNENEVDLYKYIYPLGCEHDTLGLIGLIQPYGSIMPVAEMQARVFLDVLSGNSKLPNPVDYIPYMDELSAMIDCSPPSVFSLLLVDPKLALYSLFAPYGSYFYRLRGPSAWKGAREAILGIEDRVVKATNQRLSGNLISYKNMGWMFFIYITLIFVAGLSLIVYASL